MSTEETPLGRVINWEEALAKPWEIEQELNRRFAIRQAKLEQDKNDKL